MADKPADSEGSSIDTYFQRLEEDKAFAEELKKYMEAPVEGEEEKDAPAGKRPSPGVAPPAAGDPSEVAALKKELERHRSRRAQMLQKLRKKNRALRESARLRKVAETKASAAERKATELRSREDQNLARVEDLHDGLERLRRAYDLHLKITEGLKAVCDKLLAREKRRKQ